MQADARSLAGDPSPIDPSGKQSARDMTRYLIAVLFLATPLAAAAQTAPKSIEDCESIKVDMAYNQCLASFGPKFGARPARVQVGQDPESSVAQRSVQRRRGTIRRGRRGRQSASFSVRAKSHYAKRSYRGRHGRRRR